MNGLISDLNVVNASQNRIRFLIENGQTGEIIKFNRIVVYGRSLCKMQI